MNNSQIWSEEYLVLELKAKNPSAMDYLYTAYHKKIYAFILYLIKDADEAQDIMQDVFVKIWLNIETFNSDKSSLYTWMINICRNHCIDKLRSSQHKNSNLTGDISDVRQHQDTNEISIDSIGIKDTLLKLNSIHAELLDLAYFKGYTQAEIAEKLNKPLGTIKTNIRTAIIELKSIIR